MNLLLSIFAAAVTLSMVVVTSRADSFTDSPELKAIKAEAMAELTNSDGSISVDNAFYNYPWLWRARSLSLLPTAKGVSVKLTGSKHDVGFTIVYGTLTPADAPFPGLVAYNAKQQSFARDYMHKVKADGTFEAFFRDSDVVVFVRAVEAD